MALASVKPEDLLVEVERPRRDIGAVQRPFHAGPEVLDSVRVNTTFDVLSEVVNECMEVVAGRDCRYESSASV